MITKYPFFSYQSSDTLSPIHNNTAKPTFVLAAPVVVSSPGTVKTTPAATELKSMLAAHALNLLKKQSSAENKNRRDEESARRKYEEARRKRGEGGGKREGGTDSLRDPHPDQGKLIICIFFLAFFLSFSSLYNYFFFL
jgi:hypothetical protein